MCAYTIVLEFNHISKDFSMKKVFHKVNTEQKILKFAVIARIHVKTRI